MDTGLGVQVSRDSGFIKSVIFANWQAAASDGMNMSDFDPDDGTVWLEIVKNGTRIGIWNLDSVSNVCLRVHLYVLEEYRRKYWNKCVEPLVEFVKRTPVIKLIAEIPSNQRHTLFCAAHSGFERCGLITDAIIENGQLADIVIYSKDIRHAES